MVRSLFAVGSCLILGAEGSAFLKAMPVKEKHVERSVVEQTLLTALSMDSGKLDRIEDELRPSFASLPKNSHGRLEKATVHYSLHRYFVQKHGWYIKGLLPLASQTNSTSLSTILRDRAPAYIEQLLAKHISSSGWQLRDLAIYASALSELVRMEAVMDLEGAYGILGVDTGSSLDEGQFKLVFDTYLLQYIFEESAGFATFEEMLKEVEDTYPGWDDFRVWAHDLHASITFFERGSNNPFTTGVSFQRLARSVEELGHAYGAFQHQECNSLKEKLSTLEFENTGRIPLGRFYQVGLGEKWRFWESTEYLRYLGSLDETRPEVPMLIIPNFVSGHSNCVASSSFIEVCCSLECDSLMGTLERELPAPELKVEQIVEVVSRLPSETVDAPRNLSTSLVSRLDQIAAQHNGVVPLHGRLFAQWMHHAYPLECPYPAVEANRQLTHAEFDQSNSAPEAIMEYEDQVKKTGRYQRQWAAIKEKDGLLELPWSNSEELVSQNWQGQQSNGRSLLRPAMFVLALVSMMVPLVKASRSVGGPHEEKVFV